MDFIFKSLYLWACLVVGACTGFDMDKVSQLTAEIKSMLEQHPDIDHTQTIIVNFNRFADSALECFIYCFTKTTVWTEYHQVKEAILLQIGEIIARHGAEMAFPSHSVYFETPLQVEDGCDG